MTECSILLYIIFCTSLILSGLVTIKFVHDNYGFHKAQCLVTNTKIRKSYYGEYYPVWTVNYSIDKPDFPNPKGHGEVNGGKNIEQKAIAESNKYQLNSTYECRVKPDDDPDDQEIRFWREIRGTVKFELFVMSFFISLVILGYCACLYGILYYAWNYQNSKANHSSPL